MANIRKVGKNAYKITVSCGYDIHGKHIRRFLTYKPDEGMSESQIKKAVNREAVLFEESCKQGYVTSAIKFEKFAEEWFKNVASIKLKERTLANYRYLSRRVYAEFGHMAMSKITPRHVQKFISDLGDGERHDRYKKGNLKSKTIKNHIALLSGIFEHAIKMQVISLNPCRAATLPKDDTTEKEIYTLEEAQKILLLLFQEESKNLHYILYFALAVYSGCRRGELLGLEHKDFDLTRQTMSIRRASAYIPKRGIFTDTLKTRNSYRTLKMPAVIFDLLARYRKQQSEYAKTLGETWVSQIEGLNGKMTDNDRIFIQWNGKPMSLNTPELFFKRFCKKHGLRYINLHGLRHFNISTQIFAGVDVKTVSMNVGHCNPNVTLGIYSHAFAAANACSMDRLVEVVGVPEIPETFAGDSAGMFTGKSAPKNAEHKKSAPTLHQEDEIA